MQNKCILLMLLLFVSPAYGMVYTWTDSVGVAHYTNKQHEIPERFRAKAKALYPEQGDAAAQQQVMPAVQVQSPAPVLQTKPEVPVLNNQPAVNAKPKNVFTDRATRKGRRNREETEE